MQRSILPAASRNEKSAADPGELRAAVTRKDVVEMAKTRKILSVLTAAAIAVSSVPAVIGVPVAAVTEPVYQSSDYVPLSMFDTDSSREAQEQFEKTIISATRKSIGDITFADLERLTSLNLSGMKLENLPRCIEYMARLRTLNLSNNLLRNSSFSNVDLNNCISLTSIDISNNYLTSVPSWYVSMDIATKKISGNLINTTGQRSITATPSTYYFMKGETINENALKNKILASVKMSDGTALPEFFYDPNFPPYNEDDPEDTDVIDDADYYHSLDFEVWDLSKYVDKEHTVSFTGKSASVDVVVRLYGGSLGNPKTAATVKIYFLDGDDPSTTKVRLETLIDECKDYQKGDYAETSWTNFEAALKTATTILSYDNADSEMIRDALTGLERAKNALVDGISADTKKVLTDLISISSSYKEADYSAASWAKFAAAVARLKEVSADTDASVSDANSAIKAYQEAQSGLIATSLSVPDKAPKSDFDAIYGENKTVTYSGVTRDGYKYKWTFNGKDITDPKAFDPEIKYESANEEAIRLKVGSASDYQIISFAETGTFPGKASITLDVSGKYTNGTYRLYKWDASAKTSELIGDVTVKSGSVTLSLDEGGDYFISSVLQNFEMISNNFAIDHSKLTISSTFKKKYTVRSFKDSLENGDSVTVRKADGIAASDSDYIATGMTATAAGSSTSYTVVVPGDIDGDGNITALDAVVILRAVTGEVTIDAYAQKAAGDVNGDGWVRADDAVSILKYSIGME